MVTFRSLPVIALRRMLGNWRLLSSVVVGTVIAATILSATAIYSDAIRDLGLDFALDQQRPAELDVKILQSTVGVDRVQYQRSRDRVDSAVASALGASSAGLVRMGTSATFYPTPPGEAVSERDDRPRAVLRFRSEIEDHIEVVLGEFPRPVPEADDGPIAVAVGLETATRNGIEIGSSFDIHPFWDPEADPVAVVVVGIIEAVDPHSRYWGVNDQVIDRRTRNWETLAMIVPETTFFGAMTELAEGVQADFDTLYDVEFEKLNSRNGPPIAGALNALERSLFGTEERLHVDTELVDVLETYDEKLFFTRLPLLVLMLQIGGIVAYYLVMVSTMLVERQAAELALLRSRGATTAQLLVQYGIEGTLLAVLAAATGPPLAATVISLLGLTPAFEGLSGGGLLEVNVSMLAYLLAGGGALIAFTALMLPAWGATRATIIEFKRTAARPKPTPPFLRYYLDVALVVVSAIVFWQLSQQEELFTESLFGEIQADPFLLLTPAVFLLTVGIVFLRLFPLVLRVVAAIVGRTRSVAVLVGMRALVRNPTHYTRLILLLMFATGVGMFGASFSATLDRSYGDRAAYAVGADVRVADLRKLSGLGEQAFREAVSAVPADVVSPAARVGGQISTQAGSVRLDLLGVEPETFRRVSFYRSDFSLDSLDEIAETLSENRAALVGLPIPDDAQQIGAWVKTPDIRGAILFGLTLRDATGRYVNAQLGEVRPNDPTSEEWRFLSRDFREIVDRFGSRRGEQLVPPLTLHSYFMEPRGSRARAQGTVLLGPVLVTSRLATPRDEQDEPLLLQERPFRGAPPATIQLIPALEQFEVIQGLVPTAVDDSAVADPDAPPGQAGSRRFEWAGTSRRQPRFRGLRQPTDGEPIVFYLLRPAAQELELQVGDNALVFVARRYTQGVLAGVVDFFPTVDTDDDNSLAVVNLSRLLAVANASPNSNPIVPNEAWYATADPLAVRAAIDDQQLQALVLTDVESERRRQEQDPLVAAGWQGILAIAFGAVLLLSAIGFLVYSYLTAQERALEFAILRTLGFSRWQVFSLVAFEHVFIIVAGMGLGTVVGIQVGRMMMGFLGTDERGREVLPPFILAISWASVLFAWGILSAVFVVTIGAVVLLYWRLAVHRALRIGDA